MIKKKWTWISVVEYLLPRMSEVQGLVLSLELEDEYYKEVVT